MNRCGIFAAIAFFGFVSVCQAEEATDLKALLTRWHQASIDCKSLDTKVRHFSHNCEFGKHLPHEGRYFFEASKSGRYQVGEYEAIVWKNGTTLWINYQHHLYYRITSDDLVKLHDAEHELQKGPVVWLRSFCLGFNRAVQQLAEYRQRIPFLLLDDVEDFRRHFEFQVEMDGEDTQLTATLKPGDDECYRVVQFRFRNTEDLPYAIRLVRQSLDIDVFLLSDTQINRVPADRDELVNPDVSSLKLLELLH